MLRLILDRSGGCASLAVSRESEILCELFWEGGSVRSPEWFSELSSALDNIGVHVEDIDEFVCAVGPGSFSGIRSALAALEGMALPGGKPVLGISSAAALAFEHRNAAFASVSVIGDARRSRLWLATYKFDPVNGVLLQDNSLPLQTADDFKLIGLADISKDIPDNSLIISPDWDRLSNVLSDNFSRERLVSEKLSSRASVLAQMAQDFPALCRQEPMPIYLHPAVVER